MENDGKQGMDTGNTEKPEEKSSGLGLGSSLKEGINKVREHLSEVGTGKETEEGEEIEKGVGDRSQFGTSTPNQNKQNPDPGSGTNFGK